MIFSEPDRLAEITLDTAAYAALDTETTGISPWSDRIIEIGIVRWRQGARGAEFQDLVRPDVPVKPNARRVHSISDRDLASAPGFRDIARELAEILQGTVIVGHRTVGFDMPFLNAEMVRAGLAPLTNIVVDTSLLKKDISFIPGNRRDLSSLARTLGVKEGERHRALADARLALRVWLALREKFLEYGKRTLLDILPYFSRPYPQKAGEAFRAARRNGGYVNIKYPAARRIITRRICPLYYRKGSLVAAEESRIKSFKLDRMKLVED